MRQLIAALFAAASIAAPAAAQRDPGAGGFQPRGERMAQDRAVAREGVREVFSGRAERQERRQVRQERREERQAARPDRGGDRQGWRPERRDDRQAYRAERRTDEQAFRRERRDDIQALRQGQVSPREFRRDRAQDWRGYERDRVQDRREFRRDRLDDRRDFRRDQWGGNNGRWNRDWRQDRRYDWQGWRQRNGGLYRLPRYVAPPSWGYGYRRFGLGVYLGAPLFASDYWLSDPWSFRLPQAGWPYQWVRYFDDVLLVDTRSGYVVDAIYGFFW